MAANDVQIRISAKDFASAALKNVANSAENTARSFNSLSATTRNFVFNAASITAGIAGFQGLTAAIQGTAGSVFQFARSMETNEIGIAGILSSMTQVNGKNLEWNQALGISKSIMSKLNDEALRTNATTEELTTTFRALLGPGLGAGMKVDEIVKISSVGATAVKSLGLNGTQLVQELRDLVQGGIQPASSTLATALGLKDKDIKAARESSEGLFNFLMERLAGFSAAGEASKKTMDGILDQIKEGTQRVGAEGTAAVYQALKMELAGVANSLIYINEETKKIELNPQLVNDLRYISTQAISVGRNFKDVAVNITEGIMPAVRLLGEGIVFVGAHAEGVGTAVAGWMVVGKISAMYRDVALAAGGATTANTLLGRAVLSVSSSYNAQALTAKKAATQEMQSAIQATTTINSARQARITAAQNERIVTQGILRAERDGWGLVAAQIRGLKAEYMQLGATAKQAGAMQLQAARAVQGGQIILAQHIMATQRAHMAAAASATASATAAISGAGKAAGAIRTLGTAVWALAGGWVGVAAAIGYAIYQLYEFGNNQNKIKSYNKDAEVYYRNGKYYKRVWETGKSNDPNDRMRSGGGVNSGRYVERELSQGEYAKQHAKDQQEKDKAEELRKLESGEWLKEQEALMAKHADGGGTDSKGAREAERRAREEARLKDKVADMIAGYNKKIIAENGTEYSAGMLNLNEEIANTRRELAKNETAFKKYGINIEDAEKKIEEYRLAMTKKITEEQLRNLGLLKNETEALKALLQDDFLTKAEAEYQSTLINIAKQKKDKYKSSGDQGAADDWAAQKQAEAERKKSEAVRQGFLQQYGYAIGHNDLLIQLDGKTQAEVDRLNRREMQNKIAYFDKELREAALTKEKRLELEKEKSETIIAMHKAMATDSSAALYVYLDEMKKQSTDWTNVYRESFNSINDSVEKSLNNILNRSESFSDSMINVFTNIANEIKQTWIKMWYEMTIKKPLYNMIGSLFGNITGGTSYSLGGNSAGNLMDGMWGSGVDWQNPMGGYFDYTPRAAGGPVKPGQLYKVGESGEEWFVPDVAGTIIPNYRLPKQEQGHNTLSASAPNVTVNVINKTNTEIKATATTKFDNPKNMVIQIIAEAIPRNEGGLGDLITAMGRR